MSSNVVITGIGAVTALGGSVESTWGKIISGESARRAVTVFNASGCRCQMAAEVDVSLLPPPPDIRKISANRAMRLAYPALREALRQAQLVDHQDQMIAPRMSFYVSTTGGSMVNGEEFFRGIHQGKRSKRLKHLYGYQPQQQIADLQEIFGICGPSVILANACASGANAIGHGFDMIRGGYADCVIVGGYEALTELIFVGFDCLQATSTTSCRPFDQNRDGLMIGEGAGFLVLETESHARRRGVEILGSLCGYGSTTDLHHLTQPSPDGGALEKAMTEAVRQARISPSEIGYINAHGTATVANDGAEVLSYRNVLKEDLKNCHVSSTKAAIGHTLGAAGAIESILAVKFLHTEMMPPQIETKNPIPEIEQSLVPLHFKKSAEYAMNVNLGFGGSNAALVFRRGQ